MLFTLSLQPCGMAILIHVQLAYKPHFGNWNFSFVAVLAAQGEKNEYFWATFEGFFVGEKKLISYFLNTVASTVKKLHIISF